MDRKTISRIIQNNKNVPFIAQIISQTLIGGLHISEYKKQWIVHAVPFNVAVTKNDFIEFDSKEDAQDFVDSYKSYYDEIDPEEMTQKEFEAWRGKQGPVKFKYSGTIERVN